MLEQTSKSAGSKTMPYYELSLEDKLADSVSSIGSSYTIDDESEQDHWEATPNRQRRRATAGHTLAAPMATAPVQQRSTVRRPHTAESVSSHMCHRQSGGGFGANTRALPKMEATGGATTSLRTMLASEMNREQRPSWGSNDVDKEGSVRNVRYSRRRQMVERSRRDSARDLKKNKMRFPRMVERMENGSCPAADIGQGSSRWAVDSTRSTEESVRPPQRTPEEIPVVPQRQLSLQEDSEEIDDNKCRFNHSKSTLSKDTAHTALITLYNDSMGLLDDSGEFASEEVPPQMPKRQMTEDQLPRQASRDLPQMPKRQMTIREDEFEDQVPRANLPQMPKRRVTIREEDVIERISSQGEESLPRIPRRQMTVEGSCHHYNKQGCPCH